MFPRFAVWFKRHVSLNNALLVLVLGTLIVVGWFALITRQALCSFTDDLAARADTAQAKLDESRAFVKTHPGSILGFPHATIVASLDAQQKTIVSQRATLRSLRGLHC
jgi:hypothetical protein